MTKYVDGFVLVVPKKKLQAYKKMALGGKKMWKKYGALDYYECVGDDLYPKSDMAGPPEMKVRRFPEMARAGPNDAVLFSFIVYKSRAHRDQVNKKVMKQMAKEMGKQKDVKMPFDMRKMAYGGFKVLVEG